VAEEAKPTAEKPAGGIAGAVGFILVVVVGAAIGSSLTKTKAPDKTGTVAEARALAARGEREKAIGLLLPIAEDPDAKEAIEALSELTHLADATASGGVPLHDTALALGAALEAGDEPQATIAYVSPLDGSPVLPTLGCAISRLRPGRRTRPIRRTGSSVHVVFRGRGGSVIEGQRFAWQAGDSFVVPSWAAVEHEASEPADLFSIDDRPIFEKLGLYREAVLDRPQAVAGEFAPR